MSAIEATVSARRRWLFPILGSTAVVVVAIVVGTMFVVGSGPAVPRVAGDSGVPPVPQVAGAGAADGAGHDADDAGAAEVGTTQYEAPADALYVSPAGDNDDKGGAGEPLRTIKAAMKRVAAGGTIVLRAGEYHEKVTIPDGKPVTIQSYPGEAAWLDGSRAVDGWVADGENWRAGWDLVFDYSPTYSRGVEDNAEEHWQFINPEHPMAAHPDQVWVDDEPLRQAASLSELDAESFYVDEMAATMYLGSDPDRKSVV